MKTFAPKGLWGGDLRALLVDLQCTQIDACKYLKVSERTFRRWLSEDSAPYAVLAALWHETPLGRETAHIDTGNALVLQRGLSAALEDSCNTKTLQLERLLAICETGAMNEPFFTGPSAPPPSGNRPGLARRVAPLRLNPSFQTG